MNKIFFISIIVVQLVLLVMFNIASFSNEECHTGMSTYLVGLAELILFLVIVRFYLKIQKPSYIKILVLSGIITVSAFVESFVFEKTNIMMHYDVWIEKGKPVKYEK